MSTILQALKRLEQEQPSRQGGAPDSDPQGFDPRHVLHLSVQGDRRRRRSVMGSAAVLLALVLCAGGLLYMRQRPSVEPPIAPTQGQQPTAIAMGGGEQAVSAPEITPESTAVPPAFDSSLPVQIPTGPIGDRPLRRTETIASRQGDPRPPTADAVIQPAPPLIPETLEERLDDAVAVVPGTGDGRPAVGNPYAGAAPLHDERLKVQAIVWSANAADRMAVINNRVVREGMVVEGFAVVAIGEAVIYLRESGRVWQARFGSP
ncbi:hypothetical protein [Desulfatitalea alkaliphila]|uniref:Type II secretion system protein B n=1 Tax=Desulfatitalea alkaliphila TaxID=2929485 RepID=A0AA41R7G6_9BACT|nr:hypothetical protein [Desulfatitalea alkaliphila]MCJ8502938.1 hypothetical protein [Desulfatitalea alkaliphila]